MAAGMMAGRNLGDAGPETEMAAEPETADLPEEILPQVVEAETGSGKDDDPPDAAAMEIPVPPPSDNPPAGVEAEAEADTGSALETDDRQLDPLPLAARERIPETPGQPAE